MSGSTSDVSGQSGPLEYRLTHSIAFEEPELSRVRAAYLAELEEYLRTHKPPKNARFLVFKKQTPKSKKAETDEPLYIDDDFLKDPAYQGLSIVAKLTWHSIVQEEHRSFNEARRQAATHPSKTAAPALADRTIKSLIWVTAFDTIGGKMLTVDDLRAGVDELKAVGFVQIDQDNKVSFPKYISFGKPTNLK